MTERKPPRVSVESWVDRQIREAAERGEFDNLPGAGKPLPGHGGSEDEMWWVKGYLRREGLSTEDLLPTPLRLRKEIERLPDIVRDLSSEPAVRQAVAELNQQIVEWLRAPSGPQVPIGPVDQDDVVARWRTDRTAAGSATGQPAPNRPPTESPDVPPTKRIPWWRRFLPAPRTLAQQTSEMHRRNQRS